MHLHRPRNVAASELSQHRIDVSGGNTVSGVRRVWDTVKYTSPTALISTVMKLTISDISSRLVEKIQSSVVVSTQSRRSRAR